MRKKNELLTPIVNTKSKQETSNQYYSHLNIAIQLNASLTGKIKI